MSEEILERSLAPISLRLSWHQLRLINPGLGLIVVCYNVSRTGRLLLSSHGARRSHLSDFKSQGVFNTFMMEQIVSTWSSLCSKSVGSRLKMNTFQIRACIFALRIEQEAQRDQERSKRKKRNLKNKTEKERKEELKRRRLVVAALRRLKADSKRVICTLERLAKKSGRNLMKLEGTDHSKALIEQWRQHLQWMRMHLVYFRPTPPPVGSRRRHVVMVDHFVQLAIEGLAIRELVPPPKERLRLLIRRALKYQRAGRLLLNMRDDEKLRLQLSSFVWERCNLRNYTKGKNENLSYY